MNLLVEPFIVYAVLFLPGFFSAAGSAEIIHFSISREIIRTLGYTLPSLLLIWYLLYHRDLSRQRELKPRTGDLLSLALALPGLLGIGLLISLISPLFSAPAALAVEAPKNPAAILVMCFSCLTTGYLEETYFRHYLYQRFRSGEVPGALGIGVSVLLFSLCHVYEGFWGTLNAALAGLMLALIYRKYRGLHGIAWAHGLYNAFIYLNGI
jgi:membrane protease YdiL (CAAX protease family)